LLDDGTVPLAWLVLSGDSLMVEVYIVTSEGPEAEWQR